MGEKCGLERMRQTGDDGKAEFRRTAGESYGPRPVPMHLLVRRVGCAVIQSAGAWAVSGWPLAPGGSFVSLLAQAAQALFR